MKPIKVRECFHCKADIHIKTDPFVINGTGQIFCHRQIPGYEPTKDCMSDYLKNKKDKHELPIKKKLEEKERQKETEKEKEEKRLEARPRVLAKLAELNKFLKEKQIKNRYQR
jgi:hypothetical protein|tara:strand:- start:188 stop:526 length:339 start_codon:yes stop_codon:yes gene_type:complete